MTGPESAGRPVVIAAPSGAGKTTVARRLVAGSPHFVFSISATTRVPRDGEVDGHDYRFVDVPTFRRMVDAGELIEWAEVHGNLYGTPADGVQAATAAGRHVVLDIDVQGARQIRETLPQAVLVFLLPPSGEALKERLAARRTESPDELRLRLGAAVKELDEASTFDYAVVNDHVEMAVERIEAIVEAERHRLSGTPGSMSEVDRVRAEVKALIE